MAQKNAEKMSVADQLYDLSEQNLRRLNYDIKFVAGLLTNSGELKDYELARDKLVAARVEDNWILGIIDSYSPLENQVVVSDKDEASNKYTLDASQVVLLTVDETLAVSTKRLNSTSRRIYAIYPGTTTFYAGQLNKLPYQSNNMNSFEPPGTIVCKVQFDEEDDTKEVPVKHVFTME